MLQRLVFHTKKTLKATITQDLDPRPLTNNVHPSVLPHDLYVLEPGEMSSRILSWNPLGFLSQIRRSTNDDRFSLQFGKSGFALTLVYQYQTYWDLLICVLVTPFTWSCKNLKNRLTVSLLFVL